MSIKLFVLLTCASTSSTGFPANSGLNGDQLNCGIGPGLTGGAAGYTGGTACCVGGAGGGTGGEGGPQMVLQGMARVLMVCHKPFLFIFEKDCQALYLL